MPLFWFYKKNEMTTPDKDQEFLLTCIANFSIFFSDSDIAFIKDCNYNYVAATLAFAKIAHPSATDICETNILGNNDAQILPTENQSTYNLLLQKIRYYDDLTMIDKKSSVHLVISISRLPLANQLKPLINPATGNVVGELAILNPLHLINIPLFILKNSKQYQKREYLPNTKKLTESQQIVIFLLCNFLSASEINIICNALGKPLSVTRINNVIQELKNIFAVKTKEALLEKALRMNYHIYAPETLFPEVFYDLDEFVLKIV